MQVESLDQGAQVPPCHAAYFSGLLVEKLTDYPLSEMDVAWTLGWRLSSVAKRMVSLGEDAVARHEM